MTIIVSLGIEKFAYKDELLTVGVVYIVLELLYRIMDAKYQHRKFMKRG